MSKNLVLWVENEPERLRNFKRDIEEDGEIELIVRKDARTAVEYLNDNIEKLSAAVLDIESFIDPNSDEETKTSFSRVRDCINKLEHRNKIEYFAFTGKGKYLADKEGFREEYECEIFDKNYQSIEAEEHLKKIVDRHVIARISSKYKQAFSLSSDIQMDLLQILMILENGDTRNADVFNKIRKVLEWVMEFCYDIGLSPVQFTGSNIGECSRFLGSNDMKELVPIYIQRSIHSVVEVSNNGSHGFSVDEDTKNGAAPYLVQSTVFELLNILSWLKTLPIDEASVAERSFQTTAIQQKIQNKRNIQNTI